MLRRLDRYYGRFIAALGMFGGLLFAVMALAICVDVGLRAGLGRSISWAIELFEYAMLVATLLAAPWLLRENAHVTIDILASALNRHPRRRRAVSAAAALVGAGICAVVAYYGAQAAGAAFARGSLVFKTVVFPEWWVLALVPLGMTLTAIEFIRRAALLITGHRDE